MQNGIYWMLIALIAGTCMPTQGAINNKLALYVQHPVLSAFISFGVGTLTLLFYILATGIPLNQLFLAKNAPAVAWTGGLLGAFFVAAVVNLVPRLGVAITFSLIVAGQLLITLVIDHYGLFGVPVKLVNLPRILGIILIIGGVILVRRF